MARVLIHQFCGGEKAYIEADDDGMIRHIAEILARNIIEIDDPNVVEEITACFDDAPTIDDAEVAIEMYSDEVPGEKVFLLPLHGGDVTVETPVPPVEVSLTRMRQHLDESLGNDK